MAQAMEGRPTASLEKVVLAQAFELDDLVNVLERRGLITKAEILEEIKRLKGKVPRAQ